VQWKPGDLVVCARQKHSNSPGSRARHIDAAAGGETYSYVVDKFWIVQDIGADGQLVLLTRQGKQHTIHANDPRLRRVTLWERWRHRQRLHDLRQTLGG
jgi:hypothetical protein